MLSPAQERVLRWLWAHPTVMIQVWEDGRIGRGNWTHWWRSEAARQDMERCARILNGGYVEAPRRAPARDSGGTPRLVAPTFYKLRDLGLVGLVRFRPKHDVWAACWFYSITAKGKAAIGGA